MNITVRFNLDAYGASILLDNQTLSQYSELNSYLNDDFITWADRFFEMLDEEAQTDYELLLEGLTFHYCILSEAVSGSRFCKKLSFSKAHSAILIDDRIKAIEELCARYHVPGISTCLDKLECECSSAEETQAAWPGLSLIEHGYSVHVRVCKDMEETRMFANDVFVVPAEKTVCISRGRRSVVEIARQDHSALEEYLNHYELKITFLKKSIDALQSVRLTPKDQKTLKGIVSGQPQFYFSKIPENMDVSENIDIEYGVVPSLFPQSLIKVEVGDTSVLTLTGGMIRAKAIGTTYIRFLDADGKELFRQDIQVVKHQYIEKIMINSPTAVFTPNSEGQLSIYTYPEGAEDEEHLDFHLSDKSVAIVFPSGKVVTRDSGVCRLTISAKNVSESFDICVVESVQAVSVYPESCQIMSDETQELRCEILPNGALADDIEWTVDNVYSASLSLSSDGRSCTVHPSNRLQFITNVAVTCKTGGKEATSIVQVKPVNKREFLQITTILATVGSALLCFLAFFDIAWYVAIVCCFIGMSNNRTQDKTYKTCLIVNVIVFIIMIIASAAWSNAFR